MEEAAVSALKGWETYYVIVGSTAGALIGLQFVVLTLVASSGAARRRDSIAAYGSPNIVHFSSALLVATILSAPWSALRQPGVALAVTALLGLVYCGVVLRRALRQRGYQPVLEDWVWHTILPTIAYAGLLFASLALSRTERSAMFVIGGATLMLLFIGIHNAWDTVVYVTVDLGPTEPVDKQPVSAPTTGGPSTTSISTSTPPTAQ